MTSRVGFADTGALLAAADGTDLRRWLPDLASMRRQVKSVPFGMSEDVPTCCRRVFRSADGDEDSRDYVLWHPVQPLLHRELASAIRES